MPLGGSPDSIIHHENSASGGRYSLFAWKLQTKWALNCYAVLQRINGGSTSGGNEKYCYMKWNIKKVKWFHGNDIGEHVRLGVWGPQLEAFLADIWQVPSSEEIPPFLHWQSKILVLITL